MRVVLVRELILERTVVPDHLDQRITYTFFTALALFMPQHRRKETCKQCKKNTPVYLKGVSSIKKCVYNPLVRVIR